MRTLPRFGLLLVLVAALSWTGDGLAQKKGGKKPGGPGKGKGDEVLRVDEKLTAGDPKDKVRTSCHAKTHPIKFEAGVVYTIDLVSNDFDSFLRLEDAQGKEVAKDDDTGGDFNARIVYKADKSDMYQIIVTTYSGGDVGAYRFTVTQQLPKKTEDKKTDK